jgi:hypothetical protein
MEMQLIDIIAVRRRGSGMRTLVRAHLGETLSHRQRQWTCWAVTPTPDIVARLNRILAGQGRDRPSRRPVPSVRQKQIRLSDSQRSELLDRYLAGEPGTALAKEFGVHRATAFSFLRRAGVQTRYRILSDEEVAVASNMYEAGSLWLRSACTSAWPIGLF